MEKKELLRKLNWFYSLEVTQVDNYLAQSKAVEDSYIALGLERVAIIEQSHVDNISSLILSMGFKPTIIGDILSLMVGTTMGKVLGITDVAYMLRTDIKIEAKAVTDYNNLIRELESEKADPYFVRTLKYNMVDEDIHSSWFAQVIEHLEPPAWPLSPELAKEEEYQLSK